MLFARNKRGGTLALVASLTFVTVLLGIGIFFLTRIVGGAGELSHAVDAGNLNLAKQVLIRPTVNTIPPEDENPEEPQGLREDVPDEAQFIGVSDITLNNAVNLNNVNRLNAQALLVAGNARAMQREGSDNGDTVLRAQSVMNTAEIVNNNLAVALSSQNSVGNFFAAIANSNSIRMLTGRPQQGDEIAHLEHRVAFSERQTASNVRIFDEQIPDSVRELWNANKATWLVRPASQDPNRQYLRGYQDGINFLARDIHFVPLKDSSNLDTVQGLLRFQIGQPQLISRTIFERDANRGSAPALATWANPVPNAFYSRGDSQEEKSASVIQAPSCALSRSILPRDGFYAAIARGFVRIANRPCSSGSFAGEPEGQDAFVFLMDNPQVYGKPLDNGILTAHFQKAGDGYLERIVEANNANPPREPDPADCSALHPPADRSDCVRIQAISSPPINNHNYQQFPAQFSAIVAAYNLVVPGGSGIYGRCEHALELANLDLLTQRSGSGDQAGNNVGQVADPAVLPSYFSGVGRWPARVPLAGGGSSFVRAATLAELLERAPGVRNRLRQRCHQILPTFNGNLDTILGYSSVTIPQGGYAYIFFNGTTNPDGRPVGNLVLMRENEAFRTAPWLGRVESPAKLAPDGKVGAYDVVVTPFTGDPGSAGTSGEMLVNHQEDWGFPQPYDFGPRTLCNKDTFLFVMSTGYRGLLGVIDMGACFGSEPCVEQHREASPGNPLGNGPSYRDCRCVGCSFSGPC